MISQLKAESGKAYELGELRQGHYQYMDRLYQFDYVPEQLSGCTHIRPHGDDKMTPEDQPCFSFTCDQDIDVYVLYPDKQPLLPAWLMDYERMRLNVTRMDSMPSNLKGYFSLYRKRFPKGNVVLYGNSPQQMLDEEWYASTSGANYCMYSVCVTPASL